MARRKRMQQSENLSSDSSSSKRLSVEARRQQIEASSSRPSIESTTNPAVFIYCRVSDNKSVISDLSLPDQERQARARAAENGWTVLKTFIEPGLSAKTADRPQFQRMIAEALDSSKPVQKIIVHSISRFARNVADYNRVTNQLYENGVEVVSLTQQFSNDTGGFIAENTTAVFDEYHSRRTSTDVTRTMTAMAKEGYAVGGVQSLGYKLQPDELNPRRKRVVVDENERPLAAKILHLALYGNGDGPALGIKAIVNYLNNAGYRTRSGAPFSTNYIHSMLTNPIYMGRKLYNQNAKAKRWTPVAAEIVEIPVPPIITPDEFAELQKLLRSKNPRKGTAKTVSSPLLLSGLVHCECGSTMTLRTGTGRSGAIYRYYHCSRVAKQGRHTCNGATVPEQQLDDFVVEAVIANVLVPDRLRGILDSMNEKIEVAGRRGEERANEIRVELETSERAYRNLLAAVASSESLGSEPILLGKLAELERDLTRHRNGLKVLMASGGNDVSITEQQINWFSNLIIKRLRQSNRASMKSYLAAVVARVEVGSGEISIVGRLSDLKGEITREANINVGLGSENAVRRYKRNWCTRQDSNL